MVETITRWWVSVFLFEEFLWHLTLKRIFLRDFIVEVSLMDTGLQI
jgi:hypothetical protein